MWRPTCAKWERAELWPWTVIEPAVSVWCGCALEKRIYTLTVCFAGYRPVIGAEACLHFTLAQLKLMRVSQLGPADVAYSLLLSCSSLGYVHWDPRGPWGVSAHLRTGLQITCLVLLQWGRLTKRWHHPVAHSSCTGDITSPLKMHVKIILVPSLWTVNKI